TSPEHVRHLFEVNFMAAVDLTRRVLPTLRASHARPSIVNIGSVAGRRGVPGYAAYGATKFALAGWSEALRAELAPEGIHVLLASLGATDTEFGSHQLADRLSSFAKPLPAAPVAACAEAILRGLARRRAEIVTTAGGRL